MTHRSLKLWIRKIYRPAVSFLLAVVLAVTGIPWSLPKASAATIDVSVNPATFNPVYGGETEVEWSFEDEPHDSTIETCTVEPDPPPPPPPDATDYDPPTPYKRTSLQKLASVPAGGDKQYTYNWNGNEYNTNKPLPEDKYTVCVVPEKAEKYFYFAEATIDNAAPAAPAHLQVLSGLQGPQHVIRGVAERGAKVHLTIQYTIRDAEDKQVPGDTVTAEIDVPFDDTGRDDGSHLSWAKDFDYSSYFTRFPERDDNQPAKYIREWEYRLELNPYQIAAITATAERPSSNPYYNAGKPEKNKSGVSQGVRVLRYVAPVWNVNWEALAGYYYKATDVDTIVKYALKIANDNNVPLLQMIDNKEYPGYITKG